MAALLAPAKLTVLALACFLGLANAGNLRGPKLLMTTEEAERSLIQELVGLVSNDRPVQLEAALRSMYDALPKNAHGNLGHQAVRYVLHRMFVQRHGWYIKGLEPNGDTWSKNTSAVSLREWVPSYLQGLLEARLGERGINLGELAAFAATLEDLVRREAANRLEGAYKALEFPVDVPLARARVETALRLYMMQFLGGNFTPTNLEQAHRFEKVFMKRYVGWPEAEKWLGTIEAAQLPAGWKPIQFADARRVVEEVGEKYGSFNDRECISLKSTLMSMEGPRAGRVRLSDFYSKTLHTHWMFDETPEYLRVMGALDESNPKRPEVILANYVGSRPNCLEATGLYAICCRNECEELVGHLEREIAGPTAAPARVAELVAALPSATIEAPRALPESLMLRLDRAAAAHGGQVHLHGRLFAQWMHHAFPRECPYPHEAGTTNPMTSDEWMKEAGHESTTFTQEQLLAHVNGSMAVEGVTDEELKDDETELPWCDAEEFLAADPPVPARALLTTDPAEPMRAPAPPGQALRLLAVAAVALALLGAAAAPREGLQAQPVFASLGLGLLCMLACAAGLLNVGVVLCALGLGLAAFVAMRFVPTEEQLASMRKGF
eukprot:CAMPEP_0168385872 /NCGR_PEP_ID=MMETSP0228-20121227/15139_1 /TAXON_ID=133427 /ORGANISM="Protoceratium reticulatum, Strain CCCM 535 (=CCMP 1889)" /LENGTH=607 /DNA_ID=CAMNT_0008399061 /DNA_START=88 /DNA_END=1912 /DNA_ORIENTATION=-